MSEIRYLGDYTIDMIKAIHQGTILAEQFNTAETAGADILSSTIQPTAGSRIKVLVAASASGVFSIAITKNATTITYDFNSSGALKANALYEFEFTAGTNWSINFRYSVNANITLVVSEVTAA